MGKKQIREFENSLDALQAQIGLCRQGVDETFLIDGFAWYRAKLEGVRHDLEILGLYEQCRDALTRAEELVELGPAHDEEAGMLILNANRALTQVSGSYAEMSKKLREKPDATLDDFKPDPDAREEEDWQQKK
ncbi:hypothetical protein [Ramlibacter sp.]|uniref:hypothetical protein n=1 Tax=Ramlibacter sp. TaxID=1917967 RepID=UPI003D0972D8